MPMAAAPTALPSTIASRACAQPSPKAAVASMPLVRLENWTLELNQSVNDEPGPPSRSSAGIGSMPEVSTAVAERTAAVSRRARGPGGVMSCPLP